MADSLSENAWSSASEAANYERSRPQYAPEAVNLIVREFGIDRRSRLVELAVGTGKLTRQLVGTGAEITAIEPLAAMREVFRGQLAEVSVLEGHAEKIPLPDECADAVAVGQGWHWFNGTRALEEVSRILVPGGGIALLWNQYDTSAPWVNEYAGLRFHPSNASRAANNDNNLQAFSGHPDWEPLQMESFRHVDAVPRAIVEERMLSSSVIAVLSHAEKLEIAARIEQLLDRYPETVGMDPIKMPYRTDVYWSRYYPKRPACSFGSSL